MSNGSDALARIRMLAEQLVRDANALMDEVESARNERREGEGT